MIAQFYAPADQGAVPTAPPAGRRETINGGARRSPRCSSPRLLSKALKTCVALWRRPPECPEGPHAIRRAAWGHGYPAAFTGCLPTACLLVSRTRPPATAALSTRLPQKYSAQHSSGHNRERPAASTFSDRSCPIFVTLSGQ
jgi:hypothetical protein